jgi:hypothetical protein
LQPFIARQCNTVGHDVANGCTLSSLTPARDAHVAGGFFSFFSYRFLVLFLILTPWDLFSGFGLNKRNAQDCNNAGSIASAALKFEADDSHIYTANKRSRSATT